MDSVRCSPHCLVQLLRTSQSEALPAQLPTQDLSHNTIAGTSIGNGVWVLGCRAWPRVLSSPAADMAAELWAPPTALYLPGLECPPRGGIQEAELSSTSPLCKALGLQPTLGTGKAKSLGSFEKYHLGLFPAPSFPHSSRGCSERPAPSLQLHRGHSLSVHTHPHLSTFTYLCPSVLEAHSLPPVQIHACSHFPA